MRKVDAVTDRIGLEWQRLCTAFHEIFNASNGVAVGRLKFFPLFLADGFHA
jgi:hypothetical protein